MKARLQSYFKTSVERVDALSLRERSIIFIAVMIVIYVVAVNIVFGPLRTEHARVDKELTQKRDQVQALDKQIQTLVSNQGEDINTQNGRKLSALQQQAKEIDQKLDAMTAGVVSPREMAKLVEQMLAQNRGLELVKLESLPSVPVTDETKIAERGTVNPNPHGTVYKHGMRIELKGRYFDIVNYLKALEALQWKVFWGEVTLETQKYPVSRVSLVIYTLSRYPNWIGV